VVLSYGLLQRLGASTKIVGQQVRISGEGYTVVGVMPRLAYTGPFIGLGELWMPSQIDELRARASPSGWRGFRVLARLKPAVGLDQARAEMEVIASQLAQEFPIIYSGYRVMVRRLHDFAVGDVRSALFVLLGAVGFVLLIACANLANLLLAKALARQKEIAIRLALGAGRRRLIRQLLTESVLLSIMGTVVGLLLVYGGIRLLVSLYADNIPRVAESNVGGTVLVFAASLSLLTSLLFGLVPALAATQTDLNKTLKEGSRGATAGLRHDRFRGLLIASEVAIALVLLIGAGLMTKSLWNLSRVNVGFQSDHLLTMDLTLPGSRYKEVQQRVTFFRQLLVRLEGLPGVGTVGANRYFPLRDRQFSNPIFVEGQPVPEGREPVVQYGGITSGYFWAMGIPLLKGRDFSEREMWETGGVVIINAAMAHQLWTTQDPLGKRIKHGAQQNWLTVVGVVGDVRQRRLDLEPYPQIYVPHSDYQHTTMTLAVRTGSNPTGLVTAIRREISALDPSLPIFNVMTFDQALTQSTADRRLTMTLLSLFAALAMALATVGIYGVLSYMVSQRTNEIGVRMALGAQQGDVVKLVVGQGVQLVLVGLSVGWLAALFLARLMSSLLFGVTSGDPAIFLGVTMLLFIVTLSACFIPARRASKIDPIVAIRHF